MFQQKTEEYSMYNCGIKLAKTTDWQERMKELKWIENHEIMKMKWNHEMNSQSHQFILKSWPIMHLCILSYLNESIDVLMKFEQTFF